MDLGLYPQCPLVGLSITNSSLVDGKRLFKNPLSHLMNSVETVLYGEKIPLRILQSKVNSPYIDVV